MRIAGRSSLLWALLAVAACSKQGAGPDAPVGDGAIDGPVVPGNPGDPGLGGHAMAFYHLQDTQYRNETSITTPAMATRSSGSTIIVSVGRGELDAFNATGAAITDSKSNAPYQRLGDVHKYDRWPSGTALYAFPSAVGGSNHTVTTGTPAGDEITLAAVEVVGGTRIQDHKWNQVGQSPLTSLSVTTTGPATLVAFWWGDGFPRDPQSATANNGFVVIDTNAQERDSFVQCAVAVKNVSQAGTYNVTWTPMPEQGAQLYLVAVQ